MDDFGDGKLKAETNSSYQSLNAPQQSVKRTMASVTKASTAPSEPSLTVSGGRP